MKLNLTPTELAKIIKGKVLHLAKNIAIDTFVTDSRIIKNGDVFWALKGKRFDGNDFVDEAIKRKASGIISSRRSELYKETSFYILTKDTLESLHLLAKYHYNRLNIKTVSITGSNGKTTTKEMIKVVLSSKAPTISNKGNLNNEFGLPLSVLEAEEKHKYGVFEIGSSSPGEVERLSAIIKPDIAVITTIAAEHMEFFKTMENVFKTETEVIKNLKEGGRIVINGDNKYLKRIKKRYPTISFGFADENDLIIEKDGHLYTFNYKGKRYQIRLKDDIEHNYLNAAAAFIVGDIFNISPNQIIKALQSFEGVPLRMQVIKRKSSVIILDAYNANPQSMELALKEISKRRPYGVILGDMKELGKLSKKEHLKIAAIIERIKPEFTILIGPEMKVAYEYLKGRIKNIKYYGDTDEAIDDVVKEIELNPEINILAKASRAMRFERFFDKNNKE